MKKSGIGFIRGGKLEPISTRNYDFALQSFEDGTKVTWTIQNYVREKSRGQNNLFHMLCEIIAKDLAWSREDVKLYLKDKYGQYESLTDRNGNEMVDEDTGEILQRMKSLSEYNVEEMTELINGTYEFSAKHGIRLPDPDEARNNNLPI